jgi:hypothetical protein
VALSDAGVLFIEATTIAAIGRITSGDFGATSRIFR